MTDSSYDKIPEFGTLYDAVPLYHQRQDVAFYVDEARRAGGPVLELGCGTGRILIPTARAGVTITGLDSSREMLDKCRRNLAAEPAAVRQRVTLHAGDVRDFDLGRTYKLITAPFRVVQQLITIADQLRFLAAVRRHLAPGGRLVFDVFHPYFSALVGADGQEHEDTAPLHLADGRVFRRTYRIARVRWVDQTSEVELIYYVGDQRYVQAIEMRWFLGAELEHLIARAGLKLVTIYGDFERGPLVDGAPEQIVVAELSS